MKQRFAAVLLTVSLGFACCGNVAEIPASAKPRTSVNYHSIPPIAHNAFHFAPDGKALALLLEEKGVDNIWIQPLDGSTGHTLTDFKSKFISEFRWSRDGKRPVVLRHSSAGDVVLLHDSRSPSL